ncbi:uncharacterized protein LOC143521283 [Brachyhypopomus gauderio]|uniref:uncharacterized protein LOC143521283 n=1 Tax=Brachyhypopomus gauderio TaxID=698409 RepID=UPI0040411596
MDEEMSGVGETEPAATVAAEAPPAPRRGRGRPRKHPQEPVGPAAPRRPRGRPRGSKNKTKRATPTVEPPRVRRPRGRPRKWPQAIQQEEPQLQGEEAEPGESPPTQTPPSPLSQEEPV